jgi:hypothetical protein
LKIVGRGAWKQTEEFFREFFPRFVTATSAVYVTAGGHRPRRGGSRFVLALIVPPKIKALTLFLKP